MRRAGEHDKGQVRRVSPPFTVAFAMLYDIASLLSSPLIGALREFYFDDSRNNFEWPPLSRWSRSEPLRCSKSSYAYGRKFENENPRVSV